MKAVLTFCFLLLLSNEILAVVNSPFLLPKMDTSYVAGDSVRRVKKHSPGKALWMSAALPGLGQGYNKKYWKIPVIWAGFAGLGYGLYHTGSRFIAYRNAYRLQVDTDPNTSGSVKGVSDPATLKFYRDQHKRNLDITAICTAVWYALNLVDAAVDAHLFNYDISDDLSFQWQPVMINSQHPGIGLSFHIR